MIDSTDRSKLRNKSTYPLHRELSLVDLHGNHKTFLIEDPGLLTRFLAAFAHTLLPRLLALGRLPSCSPDTFEVGIASQTDNLPA